MSYFSEPYTHIKNKMKVKLGLSNYVTKSDLKNAIGVDKFNFAKKPDIPGLKSEIDKLDIGKLETTHVRSQGGGGLGWVWGVVLPPLPDLNNFNFTLNRKTCLF